MPFIHLFIIYLLRTKSIYLMLHAYVSTSSFFKYILVERPYLYIIILLFSDVFATARIASTLAANKTSEK